VTEHATDETTGGQRLIEFVSERLSMPEEGETNDCSASIENYPEDKSGRPILNRVTLWANREAGRTSYAILLGLADNDIYTLDVDADGVVKESIDLDGRPLFEGAETLTVIDSSDTVISELLDVLRAMERKDELFWEF